MRTAEMRAADNEALLAKHNRNREAVLSEWRARHAKYDDEACGGQADLFVQGYKAAKNHYGDVDQSRLRGLLNERFHFALNASRLREARGKIKDLINECEFLSRCMQEVESHYLARWVRFLQSFHSRIKARARGIAYAGKLLIKAFSPLGAGDKPDHRSKLYQTLQKHLQEKQAGQGGDT
jgi:chorismate mutase